MRPALSILIAALLALLVCSHAAAKDKSKTTILRDVQYVCVLGKSGGYLDFAINSRRHSNLPTGVTFTLIEPDSEVLGQGMIPLSTKKDFSFTLRKNGLHVIALKCKSNTYDIHTAKRPMAYLASKAHNLHICAGCRKLYFFVPKSVQSFSIFVHAGTPKEGAFVTVYDHAGNIVHEKEDDYDKPTEIKVQAPAGTAGQTWSVTFADGKDEALVLDDVLVYLSPNIRPFLVEQEGWAPLFGRE